MAADRVDFIDENDAGRVFLGLFEHVAHAAGADADEHLDEIRPRNGEERHACLASDGAGQQGLAGAGAADQQRALGDLPAQLGKTARITQELDDFFQFFARFIDAGNIGEGHPPLTLGQKLGLALAEPHRARSAALLHLFQREESNAQDQQERQRLQDDIHQQVGFVGRLASIAHAVVLQQLRQSGVIGNGNGRKRIAILEMAGNLGLAHLRVGHAAFCHFRAEIRILDQAVGGVGSRAEQRHGKKQRQKDATPHQQAAHPRIAGGRLVIHGTKFLSRPMPGSCR